MLHRVRMWSVHPIETTDAFADQVTHSILKRCQAFQLDGYIFANDSQFGDVPQVYAVIRDSGDPDVLVQIEEVEFSTLTTRQASEFIERVRKREVDSRNFGYVERLRFDTPSNHCFCIICA